MIPRTRSATKANPGRTTRNSLYGRSPPQPQPRKTRKTPRKSTARVAVVDVEFAHGDDMENIALPMTGKGVHIRWYSPENAQVEDVDQQGEDGGDIDMDVDDSEAARATTPYFVAGPSNAARGLFVPQTPVDLHSFDAGSVILTPVKKTRQLQRSPVRIGDKGIRCLYDQGGVLRELNTGNRFILHHPVGSSANLSRYQVEQLEKERERQIIEEQLKKLMDEKKRLNAEEEMEPEYFSDSGFEEEMHTDEQASRCPTETVESRAPAFFRGPNGELLDRFGRQMFGPEGTILIHNGSSTTLPGGLRAASEVPTEIIGEEEASMEGDGNDDQLEQEPRKRKVRFGPEGTELIN